MKPFSSPDVYCLLDIADAFLKIVRYFAGTPIHRLRIMQCSSSPPKIRKCIHWQYKNDAWNILDSQATKKRVSIWANSLKKAIKRARSENRAISTICAMFYFLKRRTCYTTFFLSISGEKEQMVYFSIWCSIYPSLSFYLRFTTDHIVLLLC